MKLRYLLGAASLAAILAGGGAQAATAPTVNGTMGCLAPNTNSGVSSTGGAFPAVDMTNVVGGVSPTGISTVFGQFTDTSTRYTYNCLGAPYTTATEVNAALANLAAQIPASGGTGGTGLTAVSHDATLTGDGTTAAPLGIAPAVTQSIATAQTTANNAQTTATAAQGTANTALANAATAQAGVDSLNKTAVQYNKDGSGNPLPTANLAGNSNLPAGTTSVKLTGVAAGAVTATSLDAVNGSQLYAIQSQASAGWNFAAATTGTGTAVGRGPSNIAPGGTLTYIAGDNIQMVGTTNSLTIALNPQVTVDKLTATAGLTVVNGAAINMGRNVVGNVAWGSLAATSLDAVNGSQINRLSTSIAGALGGGSTFNTTTGTITNPVYNIGGATYNNVGDALAATNRLAVQYVPDANGAPTNVVKLTGDGTGAPVKIANVAAGTADTDAVNYSQIKNLVGYDVNADGSRANSVTLQGGAAGPVAIHNVAAGTLPTDAANVGQVQAAQNASYAYTDYRVNNLKNYTDARLSAMSNTIEQNKKEARAGTAAASALAGLRYDDRAGKASVAGAIGTFKGATALATGIGYTAENQRLRFNAGLSYVPTTRDLSATVGATWTLN